MSTQITFRQSMIFAATIHFFKGYNSDKILVIVGSARVTDDNWTDAKAKLQHACRPAPCS